MEEECERVEAEIAKERVHNENRMLQVDTDHRPHQPKCQLCVFIFALTNLMIDTPLKD